MAFALLTGTAKADRMDAACSIVDRRPHGQSHVPDRNGQEDAGEVNWFID